MSLSTEGLQREARATGFRPEVLEKVDRLLDLLEAIRRHPFLKSRVVLKGGTALNLFVFDVPRLSVDIDLNYIGALDRNAMMAERQPLEQAIEAVAGRQDMVVDRAPEEHAGGKWRLRYASVLGQGGTLELDINYMYRVPLWPIRILDSRTIGTLGSHRIPVLDVHELAAGKLAALMARRASRDLFDAHHLLTRHEFDRFRLRTAFVLYGAMTRRDWREVDIEDVRADPRELRNQLLPTLRTELIGQAGRSGVWAERLIDECRKALSIVLPLSAGEREFLDRLLDYGEICPESLGIDDRLSDLVRNHPGLLWKAHNVLKRR